MHRPALPAMLLLGCVACATPPADPDARAAFDEANDPAEPTNRAIMDANLFVDRNALRPVAEAYRDWLPEGFRIGVHNVVGNLGEPMVLINDLLQANPGQAWTTARRFVVNSTVGALGIFDVASRWDLPGHDADFGQTFGVWGIGEGPYVTLPLLGPSNARDATGTAVGFLANPFSYVGGPALTYVGYARTGVGVVDQRSRNIESVDELQRNSLDFYAQLRSLYRQRRQDLIEQGKSPDAPRGRVDIDMPKEDTER